MGARAHPPPGERGRGGGGGGAPPRGGGGGDPAPLARGWGRAATRHRRREWRVNRPTDAQPSTLARATAFGPGRDGRWGPGGSARCARSVPVPSPPSPAAVRRDRRALRGHVQNRHAIPSPRPVAVPLAVRYSWPPRERGWSEVE